MMKKNVTGIILAGGKSSRMGTDKSLLKYNQLTFIENIIQQLSPLVDEIMIISNTIEHDLYGVTRIADEVEDYGPVAGIYTGLKASKTDHSIVVSCDVPKVDTDLFKTLLSKKHCIFEVIQFCYEDKTTPLTAVYHKKCFNVFQLAINNKIQKLRFVVKQLHTKTITADENTGAKLANINTPKDLIKHNIC